MKHALAMIFAAILIVLAPNSLRAQTVDAALPTEASHVAILDHATGLLLYCKNCDVPMPPASMSKLMTALLVEEKLKTGAIKPDTLMAVSENAWRHGAQSDGSHMFLELNSRVRVDDLLRGLIIVSANDACIALAEGIAGSEANFVELMNKRAKELGLSSASFRNATGLPDPNHLISALDLAKLADFIIRTQPELYKIYATPDFTFNNHTQQNRNPLLGKFPGADGVKTGHTNTSGYGLVGSAVENGQRRIIVFNGAKSLAARSTEALRLMEAAFSAFETRQLFKKGETVAQGDVWLGASKTVPLVAVNPIDVGFHRGLSGQLKAEVVYQGPIKAPIKAGDRLGVLVVQGPGFPPQRFPLAAGKAVGKLNVFGRAATGLKTLLSGAP